MNKTKILAIFNENENLNKKHGKKDILKIFSFNMKRLREQAKLTQEEISFRSGLHRNYISDSERGRRNISLKSVEKIAYALDVEISDLFQPINEQLNKKSISEEK